MTGRPGNPSVDGHVEIRPASAGDVFLRLGPADKPEVHRHLPGVPTLVHRRCRLGPRHTVISWRERRPGSAPVTVTETIDMLVKRF